MSPPGGTTNRSDSSCSNGVASRAAAHSLFFSASIQGATAAAAFIWLVGSALVVALALRNARLLIEPPRDAAPATESTSTEGGPHVALATSAAQPATAAPPSTRASRLGMVEVVDLGLDATPLGEALEEQLRACKAKALTPLFLVTESSDCESCQRLDASLLEPRVQEVFGSVRLVRIARSVFREELTSLGLDTDPLPMFLRFGDTLTLRDAIHGGEWEGDVSANVAAILEAFVRGDYRVRRHPTWTPVRGSMRL